MILWFVLKAANDVDDSDSLKHGEVSESNDYIANEGGSPNVSSAPLKINKKAIKTRLKGLNQNPRFKWCLRPADIVKLKSEGIQFETGVWTKDEMAILERNKIEFCNTTGMTLQELQNLLMDKTTTAKKTRTELGVYTLLSLGMNRKVRDVYKKLSLSVDPANYKGKWTIQEEKKLIELYQKYGCRWMKIGEEMGRSQYSIRHKIRLIINGNLRKGFNNVTMSKFGTWEGDEEDRLLEAVEELSVKAECNGKEGRGKDKLICWEAIAIRVKTRNSEQCRKKWINSLSWKRQGQKVRKWTNEDFAKFVTLLRECGERYEKHVDWVSIGKDLGKQESDFVVRRKWFSFRVQVPRYQFNTFQENLDWLMENTVPKLLRKCK